MLSRYLWGKRGERKKDKEIRLVVSGESVSVRRSLLVRHSDVFRKMDEQGQLRGSKELKLKGISAVGLRKIGEYIQEQTVYFQNHRDAMEALRTAHLYGVPSMNDICSNFLITVIDHDNVCDILEFSSTHSFHLIEYHCLRFVDRYAVQVLQSDSFPDLKRATVEDVVKRHSLDVPSEILVFEAVMTWANHDCASRGIDPRNFPDVFQSARPLLEHVRFVAMSDEELSDPEVDRVYKLLCSEDSSSKRRSMLYFETRSRSVSSDVTCRPREYVPDYEYRLEVVKCDDHAVKNGESFCLRLEVLKGRVFLKGVSLAFDRFVGNKNASCLYAALSATNVQSTDQRCARGTFVSDSEDVVLHFLSPLVAGESERVEVVLRVKRAVNVCAVVVRGDVQIAMPDTRDVAMKIEPASKKSIFKSIRYFY